MEVSVCIHAMAALAPGKGSLVPFEYEACWASELV